MTRRGAGARPRPLAGGALWYKDAVVYELSVRAFHDGDGDGWGDFRGLLGKLDYLEELGVSALWLQPFYPSPLRDDGYDVSDYVSVHPACGSLADFRTFLRQAHRRGLRVITELVLNHTSDRHPWFQRARRARKGSRERDFYVWSDDPRRYADARVLFRDAEGSNWTWDAQAEAYYWHRFYAHEPDLNYDNPAVRREMTRALDFWLEAGVDGVRLDAVSYLCEREGTACDDLPATHEVLRALRAHVDKAFPGRVLMTEANLWPEEAAAYFGAKGDECHLASFTPLMPRLFTALHMEDRYPVVDVIEQTPRLPDAAQWALYLRNHDELTLQMVTEEERDAMYRAYAADPQARLHQGIRRRLAPLLHNDRRQIELLNALLFALPGTPVIYYGDELGMGDNIYLRDRDGIRTPMQWSADRNAGFSPANPQRVYLPPVVDPEFSFMAVNVAAQRDNPRSLLWWMRRLIALRGRLGALGRGSIEFLNPANRKVLAFVRTLGDERVLVVANLSRHAQHVELDLSRFAGLRPVEVFGQTRFPAATAAPYPLTLGTHAFYWFTLEARAALETAAPQAGPPPRLSAGGPWTELFDGPARESLEQALPGLLMSRRWFGGKAREIASVALADAVPLAAGAGAARIALVRVSYAQGEPEAYALPLAFAAGEDAGRVRAAFPAAVLAEVDTDAGPGLLYAAEREAGFTAALLDVVAHRRRLKGRSGSLAGRTTRAFRARRGDPTQALAPSLLSAEQSNTSIRYGERLILKLFRKLESGPNPDLELGAFLTERAAFAHIPPVCGAIEYLPREGEPTALAILQGFVANEGDAWHYTLDAVARYFEEAASKGLLRTPAPLPQGSLLDLADGADPEPARALIGPYLDAAALLGRRTAEMHVALASERQDEAFMPEPFTRSDQHSLYQSARNLTDGVFQLLRQRLDGLGGDVRPAATALLGRKAEILRRFGTLVERTLGARRTRTHGDYHLGQVLWTGRDFVIIDFEGEPARPLAARRAKRSPLRDVAGMLRSFHYAAFQGLANHRAAGGVRPDEERNAESWADFWHLAVSAAFLRADLAAARGAVFLPRARDELHDLLLVYLLEKAVYELSYELNNRPAWVALPLRGVTQLLERAG